MANNSKVINFLDNIPIEENTAMSTIGTKTRKGPPLRKEASPDHPIYKRGFVIGGLYSSASSKNTPADSLEKGNE